MIDEVSQQSMILCCLCGISIHPNALNMCSNCLQSEVDITKNINRQFTILQCRNCSRFLKNTKWIDCDLESKELLTLCLKKIKSLQKASLVDASFLWTEPHSKQIKLKITIQGEAASNTIIQQSFVVDFTIGNQQCDRCQKSFTENTWNACVQIRQRVVHKRTFLYLEQIILKHGLAKSITGLKEVAEGFNLYFESRSEAQHLVEFLSSTVPCRISNSKRLISQDFKSNLTHYKYTIFVEIVPICREDLICIYSKQLSKKLGGTSPIMVCTKVTNRINFISPISLKSISINAAEFFNSPFRSLFNSRELVEFFVIDVVFAAAKNGRFRKASIECVRAGEIDCPEQYVECESHLGAILKPGDSALGYDLRRHVFDDHFEKFVSSTKAGKDLPSVILIRKKAERDKKRNWKLKKLMKKRIENDGIDDDLQIAEKNSTQPIKTAKKKKIRQVAPKRDKKNALRPKSKTALRDEIGKAHDEERFFQELEESASMRKNVQFFNALTGGVVNVEDGDSDGEMFNLMVDE